MKRKHVSKGRPVVEIWQSVTTGRFHVARFSRNGKVTGGGRSYANTQAAHRAARTFFPGIRIERVS